MCCAPSTKEEEDRVAFPIRETLNDDQAEMLLELQRQLKQGRLRGDRREVEEWIQFNQLRPEVALNADAVGLFVLEEDLISNDAGLLELLVEAYAGPATLDSRDFLRDEIVFGKIRGTCCSINANKVLTAGHVLDCTARIHLAARKLCVVFGFATQSNNVATTAFEPTRQIAWVVPPADFDANEEFTEEWLVLELDPKRSDLSNLSHATISEKPLADRAPVYTLGHPNGLSLRYSFSPSTVPGPEGACFRAFVDTYDGASGSPVFDAISHEIVGVVVGTGQAMGTVRIEGMNYLSQVSTPQTSAGASCLRRPRS